jgi:hypothetical protein
MMFRTCGAAAQPPVRVASFPTVQVDDHLCPQSPRTHTTRRPRRNSGNSVALEPQRAKKFDILDGSNFADTLYQGDKAWSALAWKYRNTGSLPWIPSARVRAPFLAITSRSSVDSYSKEMDARVKPAHDNFMHSAEVNKALEARQLPALTDLTLEYH